MYQRIIAALLALLALFSLFSLAHACGPTGPSISMRDITLSPACPSSTGEPNTCCKAGCRLTLSPCPSSSIMPGCTTSQPFVEVETPCRDFQPPWDSRLEGCDDGYVINFYAKGGRGDAHANVLTVKHGDELVGEYRVDLCSEASIDGNCAVSGGGCEVMECEGSECVGGQGGRLRRSWGG